MTILTKGTRVRYAGAQASLRGFTGSILNPGVVHEGTSWPTVLFDRPVGTMWPGGVPSHELVVVATALEAIPCEDCDGEGNVWNNADPTSGQRVDCEACQ
jgi:hypothetical protein